MNPPKKDDDCTAYTFGNLAARVETLEERRREQHQTNLEVFQRLNTLERRQAVVVACSSIIGGAIGAVMPAIIQHLTQGR